MQRSMYLSVIIRLLILISFNYGQKAILVSWVKLLEMTIKRINLHKQQILYICNWSLFLATEAVHFQNTKGVARNMGAPLELIASDVLDHYRTYSLLERLLYTPTKLSEQPSFQLEPQSQQLLIEK